MQFGLSRTVAADCVDMNATADHIVRQNRRVLLVSRAGCYDVCAFDSLFASSTGNDVQARIRQI